MHVTLVMKIFLHFCVYLGTSAYLRKYDSFTIRDMSFNVIFDAGMAFGAAFFGIVSIWSL